MPLPPAPVPFDIEAIDDLTPEWQREQRRGKVAARRGTGTRSQITQATRSFDMDRPDTWSSAQKIAVFDLILCAGQQEMQGSGPDIRTKGHSKYLVHAEVIEKHALLINRLMSGLTRLASQAEDRHVIITDIDSRRIMSHIRGDRKDAGLIQGALRSRVPSILLDDREALNASLNEFHARIAPKLADFMNYTSARRGYSTSVGSRMPFATTRIEAASEGEDEYLCHELDFTPEELERLDAIELSAYASSPMKTGRETVPVASGSNSPGPSHPRASISVARTPQKESVRYSSCPPLVSPGSPTARRASARRPPSLSQPIRASNPTTQQFVFQPGLWVPYTSMPRHLPRHLQEEDDYEYVEEEDNHTAYS